MQYFLKYSINCCYFMKCFMVFYCKRSPPSWRWQRNVPSAPPVTMADITKCSQHSLCPSFRCLLKTWFQAATTKWWEFHKWWPYSYFLNSNTLKANSVFVPGLQRWLEYSSCLLAAPRAIEEVECLCKTKLNADKLLGFSYERDPQKLRRSVKVDFKWNLEE